MMMMMWVVVVNGCGGGSTVKGIVRNILTVPT